MPEMPEVEAFKKYIENTSLQKSISDIQTDSKSLIKGATFDDFKQVLQGKSFKKVERHGKYLILFINDFDKKIIMHFGLTGMPLYANKDKKSSYSFVKFIFDNHALFWITQRKFGSIWLVDRVDDFEEVNELGPDPLHISRNQFIELLNKHRRKNIKSLLMDQRLISGIGNEYSDEILFQAGIDPHRKVQDISEAEKRVLYEKMHKVLDYAITLREKYAKGLDERHFFADEDEKLFKSNYLQAHRHGDKKCPKNELHVLKKAKIGGRTAYYCPKEQK